MLMNKRIPLISLGLVLGLAAVSCGSKSSAPTTTAAPATTAAPTTTEAPTTTAAPTTTEPATTVYAGPADRAAAEAAITKNWEDFFSNKVEMPTRVVLLQNNQKLGDAIAAALKSPMVASASAKVKSIAFVSPTEATVTYDVLIGGTPMMPNVTGKAVFEDNKWLVSQETFCGLAALSGAGTIPGC